MGKMSGSVSMRGGNTLLLLLQTRCCTHIIIMSNSLGAHLLAHCGREQGMVDAYPNWTPPLYREGRSNGQRTGSISHQSGPGTGLVRTTNNNTDATTYIHTCTLLLYDSQFSIICSSGLLRPPTSDLRPQHRGPGTTNETT